MSDLVEPATLIQGRTFWLMVRPNVSGCWEWIGTRNPDGYGRYRAADQKRYSAHRIAWSERNGPIPVGQNVLHRCDNPPCVNPAHLFLGTQKDNVADMFRKGRNGKLSTRFHKRGEEHPRAKVTADDVRAIRVWLRAGESQAKIAAAYGLGETTVFDIAHGRIWRSVA